MGYDVENPDTVDTKIYFTNSASVASIVETLKDKELITIGNTIYGASFSGKSTALQDETLGYIQENNYILAKKVSEMPDNNDFMKYIDLLDKDRRDVESRFREDKRDMELRLSESQKESEKRLLEHFKDQEEKYIQSVKSLNEKFDNLSNKFDDVKKENDDIPKKFNSQRKWLIGILLTCAGIGIAFAIGYTQILLQVLSLIPKK